MDSSIVSPFQPNNDYFEKALNTIYIKTIFRKNAKYYNKY